VNNVILCLSLSKLGLPATRTGIVVAWPNRDRRDHGIQRHAALAPPPPAR